MSMTIAWETGMPLSGYWLYVWLGCDGCTWIIERRTAFYSLGWPPARSSVHLRRKLKLATGPTFYTPPSCLQRNWFHAVPMIRTLLSRVLNILEGLEWEEEEEDESQSSSKVAPYRGCQDQADKKHEHKHTSEAPDLLGLLNQSNFQ